MKVMFCVYCLDLNQARNIYHRLARIQIKKMLHMQITDNDTGDYPNHSNIVNILCNVKSIRYMHQAVKLKTYTTNVLDWYEVKVIDEQQENIFYSSSIMETNNHMQA